MSRIQLLIFASVFGAASCAARTPSPSPDYLTAGLQSLHVEPVPAKPHAHECALQGVGGVRPVDRDAQLEAMASCYDIPVVIHPRVKWWLSYYTGRGRPVMETFLSRYTRYAPRIRESLRDAGLPEDLVFLAMAESGLSTHAHSHAGAVGPWQFIQATAARYDAAPDYWVDPRRDFELSTAAAIEHLTWLHDRFGDWHMAAAAYNAGAGKLSSARRVYGSSDFWTIRDSGTYLRQETRDYVPKILAIALIAKHPEYFGFDDVEYLEPLAYDVVTVHDATSLQELAELTETDVASIQRLNPALRRFCTPPKTRWDVRVPVGTGKGVRKALLERGDRLTYREYVVRAGDTIAGIAEALGSDAAAIMRLNGIADPRSLEIGTRLAIPITADVLASSGGSEGSHESVSAPLP